MSEITLATNIKDMRRNILHLAWPAILRFFLQSIVGVVDVIMIGSLGAAATTLIGQCLGAKKEKLAENYGKQSAYLTVGLMILASIAMFIWIQPIIHLYTDDPDVINMARSALRIFLIFQPFFGLFMVLAGALRGAGDTKWVMFFTIVGNWGVRLIFSLLFAFYFNLGLNGFWLAMGIDVIVRAGLITWRFLSGKWKNLKVMRRKEEMVADFLE